MVQFSVRNPAKRYTSRIELEEFDEIVKGTSILGVNATGSTLELLLSEHFRIRLQPDPGGNLQAVLISTLDELELPPLRFKLSVGETTPSAASVEHKIGMLRQAHALITISDSGREDELRNLWDSDPNADPEELLFPDDRLFFLAAAPGSLFLTVVTRTKAGFSAAASLLSLFYPEGRDALVRRVRAGTDLRELEVQAKRLDVAEGLLDLLAKADRIKDPTTRERARRLMDKVVSELASARIRFGEYDSDAAYDVPEADDGEEPDSPLLPKP